VRDALVSDYGFVALRSSQYLGDRAKFEGLAQDRTALQNLGDRLDIETDFRWVIDHVALPAIESQSNQSLWLFDAVRKAKQIEHFRATFCDSVFHVHLTAPDAVLEARYRERQQAQGLAADPTPYEVAVDHDNERAARALYPLADLVLDLTEASPQNTARRVATEAHSRITS
jgi:adenylosuccinate synthase